MKTPGTMQRLHGLLLALAGFVVICVLTGCETTGQNADGTESNIPWNQPQPWEGAPGLPGMSQ
jgi:hypothetical protein